jgi:outer membrane lipoprotein-sorting protein
MRPTENIEKRIQNVPIQTSAEKDKEVFDDVLDALEKSKKTQPAVAKPNLWRIIMQNKITKIVAAAVILAAIILGVSYLGTPIDGAGTAFAAAMNSIKQARTFSCITSFEVNYEDNGKKGKYLSKEKIMFQEPNLERRVQLTSPWPEYVDEIKITDFSKRQELTIRPAEKTATLYDKSSDYEVDDKTGELKLTELDTSLRDQLLNWTKDAVEDLGNEKINGQSVRKLQSRGDKQIITAWINPQTNMPVQIQLNQLKYNQLFMYESIQIDTKLDDNLFSLEPPEGYTFKVVNTGWSSNRSKIGAKIMFLGKLCFYYASKNENRFPDKFDDLVTSGVTTNEMLKKILAAPEEPNGPSVFQYRKPDMDSKDLSKEIMIYEIFDQWPDDGIVVCFADGHAEIISEQNRFKDLTK